MDPGTPVWVTMIAPGCDLPEATAAAYNRFGAERVLEVKGRPYPHPPGASPMPAPPSPRPHPAAA